MLLCIFSIKIDCQPMRVWCQPMRNCCQPMRNSVFYRNVCVSLVDGAVTCNVETAMLFSFTSLFQMVYTAPHSVNHLSTYCSGHLMFITCPFVAMYSFYALYLSFSLLTVCLCAVRCSRPFHLAGAHALEVRVSSPCLQSCVELFMFHTFSINPLSRRHQATPAVTKPPSPPSPDLPLSHILSLQPHPSRQTFPRPVEPAKPN